MRRRTLVKSTSAAWAWRRTTKRQRSWYQKAADKNNARAMFNLGTLYEQGLGVPQDQLKALNLYRQAWGVPEDSIIFASAAQREQDELRKELDAAIAEKDAQLKLLQKQLKDLQEQLAKKPAAEQTAGKLRKSTR